MEIRIVDVNDNSHPLKTGEMEIDRVNNVMYVGAQFGIEDIDLRGIVNIINANVIFERLRALNVNSVTLKISPNLANLNAVLKNDENASTKIQTISLILNNSIKGVFEHVT